MRGKGPNGLNCWKITAVIHTSKDSDFPLAFLLRCAELSLDQGCASPIHFPTLISAKLRSLSHLELCAPGRILTHRQHLLDTLDVEVALTSCKGHQRSVRFYEWMCTFFDQISIIVCCCFMHCTSWALFWRDRQNVQLQWFLAARWIINKGYFQLEGN